MTSPLSAAYVNKSEIYDHSRPSYPPEAIFFILRQLDLSLGLPVLDVGSGPGILTRQLAAAGMPTIGVEPDASMLAKAEANNDQPSASYQLGTAEQLGVAPRSVAALVCGQSFHWFEPDNTRAEFRRVLATNNPVILIWNIRSPDCNAFHRAYEQLLRGVFKRYAETLQIDKALESRIKKFFLGPFEERTFHNRQQLSAAGLFNRTMSCSYAAQPGTREYRAAGQALNTLHQQHQQNGFVSLSYQTRVVYGRI